MKELQGQPSLAITDTADLGGLKKRQPFLDTLLLKHLQNNDLTVEDIREEVDTFMLAGHDALSVGEHAIIEIV